MKKSFKVCLMLLFMILTILPVSVFALTAKTYTSPVGVNCDGNANKCKEWYNVIYDSSNKNRLYCLDKDYKIPSTSGNSYTRISSYDIKGVGPACAFIETGVASNYWSTNHSWTGFTDQVTMLNNDYKVKTYIHKYHNSTTACSKYTYVSGICGSSNKNAVDDGSTIDVSVSKFTLEKDYYVATATIKYTKSITSYTVTFSGPSGVLVYNGSSKVNSGSNISAKTLTVKIPSSVTTASTFRINVEGKYSTSCTYNMPILKMYYYSSYVTNGALNYTGKKYFNSTTGRALSSSSSSLQSLGYFDSENKTVKKDFVKKDSATSNMSPTLGSVLIKKVNSVTNKFLKGVKFGLYSDSSCSTAIDTNLVTDSDGIIEKANLTAGTYYVKELATIDGYILNSTCNKVVLTAGETSTISIKNEPLGAIKITKTTNSSKPVGSVKFKLYSDSSCSNVVSTNYKGDDISLITTDASGVANITHLKAATYYLKEYSVPDGYIISNSCMKVDVSKGTTKNVYMFNDQYFSLNILKTDSNENFLPGAKFTLCRDSMCNSIATHYDGSKIEDSELVTDSNGKLTITRLRYGTYYLKEVKAPDGFITDDTVSPIYLTKNITKKIINDNIKMRIKKVSIFDDDLTTNLPGSKIRIVKLDDGSFSEDTFITSDQAEEIAVVPGVYAVYEDYAPIGYENLFYTFIFEVKNDGTIKKYNGSEYDDYLEYDVDSSDLIILKDNTLIIKNEPTYINLSKADIVSGKEIPGASITIIDENGNEVVRFVSDGNGSKKFNLEPGMYTLKEVVAPKGYKQITTEVQFILGDNGDILIINDNENIGVDGKTIIVYNDVEDTIVPITGTFKNIMIVTLGAALIIAGTYVLMKRRKLSY